MAKKAAPVAKKPVEQPNKQLVDAIVTVRSLQVFIQQHGGLDAALAAVASVRQLVELTGGFDALTQAMGIVGADSAPAE
jgi:hypothetical protein